MSFLEALITEIINFRFTFSYFEDVTEGPPPPFPPWSSANGNVLKNTKSRKIFLVCHIEIYSFPLWRLVYNLLVDAERDRLATLRSYMTLYLVYLNNFLPYNKEKLIYRSLPSVWKEFKRGKSNSCLKEKMQVWIFHILSTSLPMPLK